MRGPVSRWGRLGGFALGGARFREAHLWPLRSGVALPVNGGGWNGSVLPWLRLVEVVR